MKKLLVLFFILSNSILAQDNIATDRPGATASALVIPAKTFQLEFGGLYQLEVESFTIPEYLIRVGVLNFLELRVENSFYQVDSEFNNGDLLLGLKAQIFRKEQFKMAFLSTVNLAENDRSYLTYSEKLLFAFALNDKSEIAWNIGVDGLNKDDNISLIYTISYGRSITDKMGFYLEYYGNTYEKKLISETNWNSYVNVGVAYLMKERLQLDAKFGVDIDTFEGYFIGAGISFRAFN